MERWIPGSIKLLSTVVACCLVVACGGGGSSSGSTDMSRGGSNNTSNTNPAGDSEVQLSWHIPDSRENGSDLEVYEIEGYRIYYSSTATPLEEGTTIEVNDPQTTEYSITGLPSGDYRLAIATIDTQGLESQLSSEIIANVP